MKVLVTGATGFLGLRVVARLIEDRAAVTAVGKTTSRSPFARTVEYRRVDLATASSSLSPWRWDAVVNLAGPVPRAVQSWEMDRDQLAEHAGIVLGLGSILPPEWNGRFVHASSMTVYGVPETLPVNEEHARQPVHMYGLAKRIAEDIVLASGGKDRWVLRLPGLFSPERRSGGLFHFVRAAQRGERIEITASSPTCWDILHVDDAATAIARALRASERDPGALNVAYGEPVELAAMARRIANMAEQPLAVESPSAVAHPIFQMDVSRADRVLGGWPPCTLEVRLRELWRAWMDS